MTFQKTAQVSVQDWTWETLDGEMNLMNGEVPNPQLSAKQKQDILTAFENGEGLPAVERIVPNLWDETLAFGAVTSFFWEIQEQTDFHIEEQLEFLNRIGGDTGDFSTWMIWAEGVDAFQNLFETPEEATAKAIQQVFESNPLTEGRKQEILDEFEQMKMEGVFS